MNIKSKRLVARAGSVLMAALVAVLVSQTASASRGAVAPLDQGAAPTDALQSVSIVLKARHLDQLDSFIASSVDPGSPKYHQFLSVREFRERFAPSNDDVRQVTAFLRSLGISIDEVYADNLLIKATGTVAQFNQAFNTTIHDYVDQHGKRFRHSADDHDHVPPELKDIVLYVAGLDTQSGQFTPKNRSVGSTPSALQEALPSVVLPSGNGTATGIPGEFTVGDVANYYGVNPLYKKGFTGGGRTVGIATLANFYPSDAYDYWNLIGLASKPNRIRQVHVDGGGPLSTDAGSDETTLDVEQSGGLAPDANVVVYDAPNTDAGFIDVFYKSISDNAVDTLSVSWGSPELFNYPIPGISTDTRVEFLVYHQVFAEAAAQGISVFAASGDSGAYDTNRVLPYPYFSKLLTVEYPASDPYITAAGGTTLPADIQRKYGVVTVPTEQVWGWDYFNDYLVANYRPDYKDLYFAVGAGGGVSIAWPTPDYQNGTRGIRRTEPNQVWTVYPNYPDLSGSQTLTTLPSGFKGRNVPDISLNADPYTGYLVRVTPDGSSTPAWFAGYGGTSFCGPQLNGIFALIGQAKSSRLGLLNPVLYSMKGDRDGGHSKALVDITAGDNWFYAGVPGYDPGAGLGVINAAEIAKRIN